MRWLFCVPLGFPKWYSQQEKDNESWDMTTTQEKIGLLMLFAANYLKFYAAIKKAYPDIKVISNCDGSNSKLDHPAELYDYHAYADANTMFSMGHKFDGTSRNGPKAFVSEYAVSYNNAPRGNLLIALAEAGFLIGIEKNSDVVDMASKAPLFLNANTNGFKPDAIVFDSYLDILVPSTESDTEDNNEADTVSGTQNPNTSNSKEHEV